MNKCLRCGHEWETRITGRSAQCPHCKSPKWDRPVTPIVARWQVSRAIKEGKLPKLDGSVACVDCGKPATAYDHRDYEKPLEVQAVCAKCNLKRGPGLNQHERTVMLRVPQSMREAFKALSEETGSSMNMLIRKAINEYIKRNMPQS